MRKARFSIYFVKLCVLCGFIFLLAIIPGQAAFGQAKVGIAGVIDWETMEMNAVVSLDLASANIKLPTGRTQAESIISAEYLRLIRPGIFSLPVDSSATIADLIQSGEFSLLRSENLALDARSPPPSLSPDLAKIQGFYSISLAGISADLIRHKRPAEIKRTLNPAPAPTYSGIIIIASDELPVHGMKSSALPLPCLFPKIWDTNMDLIYERNMLARDGASPQIMVHYTSAKSIMQNTPSGLSKEVTAIAGANPLRILARGCFGIRPTDLIIDKEDALLIISSEANRQLLRDGKVVIVLNDEVLKSGL
jgi:hypothetical protein